MDDGSDPPLTCDAGRLPVRIVATNDKRPWTWALARNAGAKLSTADYLLMTDIDYILSRPLLNQAIAYAGDKLRFKREFGVLLEDGSFTQDIPTLLKYGLDPARIPTRGVKMPPHPNNFCIRRELFWRMGGYREDLINRPYPQGEDRHFKRKWVEFVSAGKAKEDDADNRPMLYMFPNGQFCGDVDADPMTLFHGLSRKTAVNPAHLKLTSRAAPSLSIVIPGRGEVFFRQTVENVLANARGDTEVIAVCDGNWPDPPLADHPKLKVIHHTEAVGQRAATNDGAKLSRAKYLMKLDAHCAVDEGFDVKLWTPYETGELAIDTTTIPRLYNLHAFSWKCNACGHESYQGPLPTACEKCKASEGFEQIVIWKPRLNRRTDFGRFDSTMQYQYWRQYDQRPDSKRELADVLSSVGACWFMPAERFWQLGGMDEGHGSWGQFGTEVSCKSWLSGGRQVVNKRTWFSHLFRTQWGFQWPYPMTQGQIDRARQYSRELWLNDRWSKATRPLSWLLERFWPIPGWEDTDLTKLKRGAA